MFGVENYHYIIIIFEGLPNSLLLLNQNIDSVWVAVILNYHSIYLNCGIKSKFSFISLQLSK